MKNLRSMLGRRATAAFTLAELAVGAGVTGVIATVCYVSYMALQRVQSACLARSDMRSNVLRIFDSLETDLRNATALTATTVGNRSELPLTITAPQRYTSYETGGPFAGDPSRIAARIAPTVVSTNGKIAVGANITIAYEWVVKASGSQDLKRTVTWMESGTQKSGARVIASVPAASTLQFRSGTSSISAPIKATDASIVAALNAPFTAAQSGTGSPTTRESTIFLRRKSLK
jgi:hypothetical protein